MIITTRVALAGFILITGGLIASCSDMVQVNNPNLSAKAAGIYEGTLTRGNETFDAYSEVFRIDDQTVEVNCYSNLMDTTFILDLYQDGDHLQTCLTGDEFYNEYGHHMSGDHHMMGGSERMSWSHHLDEEHSTGDEHFGGFDMEEGMFNYMFETNDNSQVWFEGVKR